MLRKQVCFSLVRNSLLVRSSLSSRFSRATRSIFPPLTGLSMRDVCSSRLGDAYYRSPFGGSARLTALYAPSHRLKLLFQATLEKRMPPMCHLHSKMACCYFFDCFLVLGQCLLCAMSSGGGELRRVKKKY